MEVWFSWMFGRAILRLMDEPGLATEMSSNTEKLLWALNKICKQTQCGKQNVLRIAESVQALKSFHLVASMWTGTL